MSKRPTRKVEVKTITMSYENLESCIVSLLYATKTIPEHWDVVETDIPVGVNDDGLIEFDIAITKPVRANLRVVDETFKDTVTEDNQLTLPLEVFDKDHVKDS